MSILMIICSKCFSCQGIIAQDKRGNQVNIFNSPEHKVLKLSYCNQPSSAVSAYVCPLSTFALNDFFTKTAGQNLK